MKTTDSYETREAKRKSAQLRKSKLVDNAIDVLDRLDAVARAEGSNFDSDERKKIDHARFNLQSIRSGWTRTRRFR